MLFKLSIQSQVWIDNLYTVFSVVYRTFIERSYNLVAYTRFTVYYSHHFLPAVEHVSAFKPLK